MRWPEGWWFSLPLAHRRDGVSRILGGGDVRLGGAGSVSAVARAGGAVSGTVASSGVLASVVVLGGEPALGLVTTGEVVEPAQMPRIMGSAALRLEAFGEVEPEGEVAEVGGPSELTLTGLGSAAALAVLGGEAGPALASTGGVAAVATVGGASELTLTGSGSATAIATAGGAAELGTSATGEVEPLEASDLPEVTAWYDLSNATVDGAQFVSCPDSVSGPNMVPPSTATAPDIITVNSQPAMDFATSEAVNLGLSGAPAWDATPVYWFGFWMRPPNTSQNGTIFGQWSNGQDRCSFDQNGATLEVWIFNAAQSAWRHADTGSVLSANGWVFVLVDIDLSESTDDGKVRLWLGSASAVPSLASVTHVTDSATNYGTALSARGTALTAWGDADIGGEFPWAGSIGRHIMSGDSRPTEAEVEAVYRLDPPVILSV